MNRAERRRQTRQEQPPQRRERTDAEKMALTQHVLTEDGECLAWLSWQGYQHFGRGVVVWVVPEEGKCLYLPEPAFPHLQDLPFRNLDVLREIMRVYDPARTYALLIRMPLTDTLGVTVRLMTVASWAPATARIDPLRVERFGERGH